MKTPKKIAALIGLALTAAVSLGFTGVPFGFFKGAPGGGGDDTTLLASSSFGQRPTAVETTQTFLSSLNYTMGIGETHGFLLKINTDTNGIDLNCSGSDVSNGDITCTFYKLWAFYPNNADAYQRASLATSPATGSDAYYDIAVAIPAGSANFTPEATSADELIWMDIAVASDATAAADKTFTINAGSTSLNPTFEVVNYTLPTSPVIEVMAELSESSIDDGAYGGFSSTSGDQRKVNLLKSYTQTMKDHRMYAYKNIIAYLADSGSPAALDIDANSGTLGDASFRTGNMDYYTETNWFLLWMSSPQLPLPADARDAAYATAAQQTITNEAALAAGKVAVYVWDEPAVGSCTNVETVLGNWNGKDTKLLLTANSSYDNVTCSGSLDFADYSDLVLTPVVNHVEISGGTTAASSYSTLGLYSSCQGNCGAEANSSSTNGTDQGYVDLAYVDLPSVRARAFYWLTGNTTYRSKVQWLLHYAMVQAEGTYDGVLITPTADTSDSLDQKYFILDGSRGSRCFWLNTNGAGSAPAGCSGADNSTVVTIATNNTAAQVTTAVTSAVDGSSEFTAYSNSSTTLNVVGDVYNGTQSAGDSGFTVSYTAGKDSWLSPRRFNIMGDGTLMYPNTADFKPFVGLAAFTKGNDAASASLRMKVIRDSSFERDALAQYYTNNTSTTPADDLVTDTNDFETTWGEYEYMRWRVLKANAAGNTIASHTLAGDHVTFGVQPTDVEEDASITPAITAVIYNRFGAVVSTDDSSTCSLSKATGSGTLTVTSPVTAVDGVCTFSDAQLDTADDYTLTVAVSGMTSDTSDTFTVTEAAGGGAGEDLNTTFSTTLVHWWRADTNTNSGGNITQWTDKKTSVSQHLVTTGTNHTTPAYDATGGPASLPIGTFTKNNKDMSHDISFTSCSTTACYVFIVFRVDNTSVEGGIAGSIDRFNDWGIKYTTSKLVNVDVGGNSAGASFVTGTAAVDTNWHWLVLRVPNTGNTKTWVDGTLEINTSGETAQQLASMRIGGLLTDDTNGNGSADSLLYGNVSIADIAVLNETYNETTGLASLSTYVCDQYVLSCP